MKLALAVLTTALLAACSGTSSTPVPQISKTTTTAPGVTGRTPSSVYKDIYFTNEPAGTGTHITYSFPTFNSSGFGTTTVYPHDPNNLTNGLFFQHDVLADTGNGLIAPSTVGEPIEWCPSSPGAACAPDSAQWELHYNLAILDITAQNYTDTGVIQPSPYNDEIATAKKFLGTGGDPTGPCQANTTVVYQEYNPVDGNVHQGSFTYKIKMSGC